MPTLEGYRFGRIVIDGEEQTRDVIVLPERVVTNWWRAKGHRLVLDDLKDVREELPKHLIVGTGAYGRSRGLADGGRGSPLRRARSRPYCGGAPSDLLTLHRDIWPHEHRWDAALVDGTVSPQ